MRPADAHLTPQELELLFEPAGSNIDDASRARAQEAQLHLAGCATCQALAKKYEHIETNLRVLKKFQAAAGADCPAQEVWPQLAAGLLETAPATRLLEHAAECDWCGRQLRESLEDFDPELSEEEAAALDQLSTSTAKWQRELAVKLAATGSSASAASNAGEQTQTGATPESRPAAIAAGPANAAWHKATLKPPLNWWPKLAWAGIGLAAAAGLAFVAFRMLRQPDPHELLAKAYTERRTIELRMPGAAYGPMRVERGTNSQDQPVQFYEAEAVLKKDAAKHAEDPSWLQAQARADLLQWQYERAIRTLDDALMLKPDDPALLMDKAMALFERAEKLGPEAAIDYGEAAEDLGRALKKNPDDLVALFNRAIIYEKIHLPSEAIADLEHYLRLDPQGPWANEARDRLKRLKELVKAHDDALKEPLAGPAEFVRLAADPSAAAKLDERIEDYQDLAIKEWLPAAYPVQPGASDAVARKQARDALRALARLLEQHHKDKWLGDLLASASQSPAFASAVAALGNALQRAAEGDSRRSYAVARTAEGLFAQARDEAGRLRAEIEQIYALRNSQQGGRCLSKLEMLGRRAQDANYRWLQVQAGIDQSSCYLMQARFVASRSQARLASDKANAAAYLALKLRSVGMAAAVETDEGNLRQAWAKDQEGLLGYWQRPSAPPMRAQQFYDDLSYSAENIGEWNLALAFADESVRMTSLAGNRKLEVLVRQHLARIAVKNGRLELATQHLNKANELLAALPSIGAMAEARVYTEVSLAEIESSQGLLPEAERRLNQVRQEVGHLDSFTEIREFYWASSELLKKQGRNQEAEKALLRAIAIADTGAAQLARAAAKNNWGQENAAVFRSMEDLELSRGNSRRALAASEWYRSATLARRVSAPSLDAFWESGDFARLLRELKDQTVVAYTLMPETLVIWVFDDRGITVRKVPVEARRMEGLARLFTAICSDPDSSLARVQAVGRELYSGLIAPVADRLLPGRILVIEPDDKIANLPFEALEMSDGHYLGEVFEVAISPGILALRNLNAAQPLSRSSKALVVAADAAAPDGSLGQVFSTDFLSEAEEIRARVPNSVLLTGDQATAENVDRDLAEKDVFHFAGHAISTPVVEGLIVGGRQMGRGPGEIWGAEHVTSQRFRHCQLAVLSACSTAVDQPGLGRGVHGELLRSLLLAGVPNVVGSRWNVDSRATNQFMRSLYGALLSGKRVSLSMKMAATVIRREKETSHPYYWAAFAVYGRG